jgi:5-(carboxyamino)imidazole ribonucleotide synthase
MTMTLGVVGGGQLGMFFVRAAHDLGFRTAVLDPAPDCPASRFADEHHCAPYDDLAAVRRFAVACDAVTVEFENVPVECLEAIAAEVTMRPAPAAVAVAADRRAEKRFLASAGLRVAPCEVVENQLDVDRIVTTGRLDGVAVDEAVVKTAQLGYDGKGQIRIGSLRELGAAWHQLHDVPCVVEQLLRLDRELSVVLARGHDGETVFFAPTLNHHENGILDTSVVAVDDPVAEQARDAARVVAEQLRYEGVLAVEFLVSDGELLVNEIAPRPHNSGHWTIDGAATSQFAQQVLATAGHPLGSTRIIRGGIAMANLLGDLWANGEPIWSRLDGLGLVHVHLYGKSEARPGRKMGHITALRDDPGDALDVVTAARQRLTDTS